jgi:uncharacterized protein YcaQ
MDIWRRIFEFNHQLEMYKPVAKRRWILRIADLARRPAGGQADRKAGLLGVDAIHQDIPFGKTTSAAVHEEIRDLARWPELDVNCLHKRQPAPRTGKG